MASRSPPQKQHIAPSQRPDPVAEAVSSNDGCADGVSKLSAAGGDNESTIGQAYVWPGSRLLKKVYCLAIDINIVGIFKAQKGTATTEDDSEEGERASDNSHNSNESSRGVGQESTISHRDYTGASNATTPPSHDSSDARSKANLSDSLANAASTPKPFFSPSPTPAYQTDCTFALTIPSYGSANAASTAYPIYQIGCNVAPNISANAASMANPVYQIGCNFTPNISVPPSCNSTNSAASTANSFFYQPSTPTAYQLRCHFSPNISASTSYNSADVASTENSTTSPTSPILPV